MILVIRLLDMAGLRMHVLPAAIDWNASLQLPVGLFGVGLEGADVCFDDGLVAVEAESRVIGCDGVAGGDLDGVRVEGDADGVPFARMACLAMFAYSSASRFDSRPASSRMVSGVSGRCGSASRLSPVNPGASSLASSSSISDCSPARCAAASTSVESAVRGCLLPCEPSCDGSDGRCGWFSSESMTSCVWPMARLAASRNSSSCCWYSCSSAGMPSVPA